MDQLICASLSHTHYSYEVGIESTGVCMYVFIVITYTSSRVLINRVKVANPARGQLNGEKQCFLVPVRA